MESDRLRNDPFGARTELETLGGTVTIYRLEQLEQAGHNAPSRSSTSESELQYPMLGWLEPPLAGEYPLRTRPEASQVGGGCPARSIPSRYGSCAGSPASASPAALTSVLLALRSILKLTAP